MLLPQICGLWDGCHLWAQWSPIEGATYLFQWRSRLPTGPWRDWQEVARKGGLRRAWLALPLWREGGEVQVRVAVAPAEKVTLPNWELAQEVTFQRNRCRFAITSENRDLLLLKGSEWSATVDGAAVTYVLPTDEVVMKGERREVEAESLSLSGYAQLDYPGHFRIRPDLGLTIENVGPSVSDVAPTGRNYTTMAALPGQPMRAVIRRSSVR